MLGTKLLLLLSLVYVSSGQVSYYGSSNVRHQSPPRPLGSYRLPNRAEPINPIYNPQPVNSTPPHQPIYQPPQPIQPQAPYSPARRPHTNIPMYDPEYSSPAPVPANIYPQGVYPPIPPKPATPLHPSMRPINSYPRPRHPLSWRPLQTTEAPAKVITEEIPSTPDNTLIVYPEPSSSPTDSSYDTRAVTLKPISMPPAIKERSLALQPLHEGLSPSSSEVTSPSDVINLQPELVPEPSEPELLPEVVPSLIPEESLPTPEPLQPDYQPMPPPSPIHPIPVEPRPPMPLPTPEPLQPDYEPMQPPSPIHPIPVETRPPMPLPTPEPLQPDYEPMQPPSPIYPIPVEPRPPMPLPTPEPLQPDYQPLQPPSPIHPIPVEPRPPMPLPTPEPLQPDYQPMQPPSPIHPIPVEPRPPMPLPTPEPLQPDYQPLQPPSPIHPIPVEPRPPMPLPTPEPLQPDYQPLQPPSPIHPIPVEPRPPQPLPTAQPPQTDQLLPPSQPTTPYPIMPPTSHGPAPNIDVLPVIPMSEFQCSKGNGYYTIINECDAYIECQSHKAWKHTCPDGLHFNPEALYPEYPCAYPSQVQCESTASKQTPKPTNECPNRYGFFSISGGDCSKYIMCQEGKATLMNCPFGLVFNDQLSSCDWPENVPQCNSNAFKDFACPIPPEDDPDLLTRYRYGTECGRYVACQRGHPRLLSCDSGLSFDEDSQVCIDTDLVPQCKSSAY